MPRIIVMLVLMKIIYRNVYNIRKYIFEFLYALPIYLVNLVSAALT